MSPRLFRLRLAVFTLGAGLLGYGLSVVAANGTDEAAEEAIQGLRQDYQPWREKVSVPGPESAWFGLQAALGAAMLGGAVFKIRKDR